MSTINLNMERQICTGVGHLEGMRGEKEFSTEGRTLNSLDVQGMKEQRLIYSTEQREID